jgi:hypothetical protein
MEGTHVMHLRSWMPVAWMALVAAAPAAAQEACKAETLKRPALTLSEVYAMAEARAKAWRPDVVPARIGNTSLGPLKPDGSSEAWNLWFYSAATNSAVTINTFRGTLTCYAQAGSAGRIPDLKPAFARDGAKLYALAQQHGGDLIARGYRVMVQTAAAPSDRHATWYLTYSRADNTDADLTVIVDANTGAVEKVLRAR